MKILNLLDLRKAYGQDLHYDKGLGHSANVLMTIW